MLNFGGFIEIIKIKIVWLKSVRIGEVRGGVLNFNLQQPSGGKIEIYNKTSMGRWGTVLMQRFNSRVQYRAMAWYWKRIQAVQAHSRQINICAQIAKIRQTRYRANLRASGGNLAAIIASIIRAIINELLPQWGDQFFLLTRQHPLIVYFYTIIIPQLVRSHKIMIILSTYCEFMVPQFRT